MINKKIKLVILTNNLNFFCSHRLPIAEAAKEKYFDVVVGYGELGGADLEKLKSKGMKCIFVPIKRGSINFLNDIKSLLYIWKFFKREKPDIVHLVTIKPYLLWRNYCSLNKSAMSGFSCIWSWNFIYYSKLKN